MSKSDSAHILTHAIANFNEVRGKLMKEVSAMRRMDYDDDETVTLTVADLKSLIADMEQGIAGLCHVTDPTKHTTVTREHCRYEDPTGAPSP